MKKPLVAIIGRINVGKSTLFNRITGTRTAIVKDKPGITRDRIYSECEWKGRPFILVDSGGININGKEEYNKKVNIQTDLAIKEADLVLLLVDVKEGINVEDYEVAKIIRKNNKKTILVANKGDISGSELKLFDFYELGFGEPYLVSAEHGIKVDNLLDKIVSFFPDKEEKVEKEKDDLIKISILGKPNVGKSSLLNNILGEERLIVSEHPGTTRDAIEVRHKQGSLKILFIDTAGLRIKSKIKEDVEYYSSLRAMNAVNNSDIVLLVIDSTQGISTQDKKITGYVNDLKKAGIIILNKFDLIEGHVDKKWLIDEIKYELPFAKNYPVVFTSALTGYNINEIFEKINEITLQYCKKIPTPQLNIFFKKIILKNPPKYINNQSLKINYVTQIGIKPPKFLLFVNNPKLMYNSYQKYLENEMYKQYGFEGSPVSIKLIRKNRKDSR
ncbi:MAG: ribosome biogenesis GTPase Der [Candidatus Caldatribacteriota bacterium]|nr:ribosome biogenesis GTPase Der [Candidatus Caldatribacteriota bacterium]